MSAATPEFGTSAYLRDEICRFRGLMGERSFWRGEKPRLALKAIGHVYLTMPAVTEADAVAFESAIGEFTRRQVLVELSPFRGGGEETR
jgi:hypothetical protein